MSQAKVDKYKQEKANRKETIAKEKRVKKLTKFLAAVVVVALVVWIGVSTVDAIKDSRPAETIYCDTTADLSEGGRQHRGKGANVHPCSRRYQKKIRQYR